MAAQRNNRFCGVGYCHSDNHDRARNGVCRIAGLVFDIIDKRIGHPRQSRDHSHRFAGDPVNGYAAKRNVSVFFIGDRATRILVR